eukprot:GHRQ01035492.1.p2 GENE.GHRQ01035492.1~~GHRQ01035492.1.p2  ORF type:complete len:139 (-),score=36.85 GHRQ01035492.1:386-802(-)
MRVSAHATCCIDAACSACAAFSFACRCILCAAMLHSAPSVAIVLSAAATKVQSASAAHPYLLDISNSSDASPAGAKAYEKAEDPIYALENNLPIDAQHYLDHQLAQPLMRIFEPVCKDVKAELLSGEALEAAPLLSIC